MCLISSGRRGENAKPWHTAVTRGKSRRKLDPAHVRATRSTRVDYFAER